MKKAEQSYAAFLRGINVGGHHKVPMPALRKELGNLHFKNVATFLNSGNVLFYAPCTDTKTLEETIAVQLESTFGFPVPTIIRKAEIIRDLVTENPFKTVNLTKDIRLYVSFLQEDVETDLKLPWTSSDNAFKILGKSGKTVISVLDRSISKTPKAMQALEHYFGKDLTTRNWNTIKRIEKKRKAQR